MAGPNDNRPEAILAQLGNLQIGNRVSYMSIRWEVTGAVDYDEDGYTWREYRLHHEGEWAWLFVDFKADPGVILYKAGDGTAAEPGAPQIVDNGVTFALKERGQASYRSYGQTDMWPSGVVEYVDYAISSGTRVLSFERYGDRNWELTKGEAVEVRYLSISSAATSGTDRG